jgi:Arc/MetJ-type ribon-helix-helix transcriptional regulator
MSLTTHYDLLSSSDGVPVRIVIILRQILIMSVRPDSQTVALELPERTIAQLDALVRHGRFANRQAAVVAAVERLYTAEPRRLKARQAALARLCGVLHLGTTRQSLRQAELDRLTWESGQR